MGLRGHVLSKCIDKVVVFRKDSVILPTYVGLTLLVYNGKVLVEVNVTKEMVGYRIGEFVICKKMGGFIHKKKKGRKKRK